jgi:hypothetical protein
LAHQTILSPISWTQAATPVDLVRLKVAYSFRIHKEALSGEPADSGSVFVNALHKPVVLYRMLVLLGF